MKINLKLTYQQAQNFNKIKGSNRRWACISDTFYHNIKSLPLKSPITKLNNFKQLGDPNKTQRHKWIKSGKGYLEADNEVFLLIDVEIVELVELHVQNPDKPILKLRQGSVRRRIIIIIISGGGRNIFEKLLQGLVGQILVPPIR